MSYQPNPKNKAFIRRANLALEFVNRYVRDTPNWVSSRWIDDPLHFGHSGNPLSQWLKSKLLIVVDDYYVYNSTEPRCKTYIRNQRGYQALKQLMNPNYTPQLITPEQHQQLVTGDFPYVAKSERYYNGLQSLKSAVRKPLMAGYGYKYEYDIVCAAPTVVRQLADKCGLNKSTPALDSYIHNRTEIRNELAKNLEITSKQAKQIIQAIVNGATIGCNRRYSIYQLLGYDEAKIRWLQQDEYIQQLKEDIRQCWKSIKPHQPKTYEKFNSQAKSRIYRTIETQIMKEVNKRLKHQRCGVRVFNEHDGWRCDLLVDQTDLRSHIKRTTGYIIDFDFEVIDYV